MSKEYVFIVSDNQQFVDQAKAALAPYGVTVNNYGTSQWRDGLESPFFRGQLSNGMPTLITGQNPVEAHTGNVLPFPAPAASSDGKVATMDELESKAIENAIIQFRGNLTEAAKALGIGRATLYRKVKQYQIDPSIARKKRAVAA